MTGPELLDHWGQGLGLCLVSLEEGYLEREPARGDQQPDGDLWVDAAFLTHTGLPEPVLVGGLEM